ncbi:Putative protein without homology [Lacticaseibacillus rhamnosus GG]|nr:Putative protein without homology [Lacticaseibacillus rhamnosus GG]
MIGAGFLLAFGTRVAMKSITTLGWNLWSTVSGVVLRRSLKFLDDFMLVLIDTN